MTISIFAAKFRIMLKAAESFAFSPLLLASLESNALLFAARVKENVFQPVFIGPSLLRQISSTMSSQNSDDAMFSSILKSMGITSYDRLVVTALNEYARRYGGTLLSDAQDYAEHAGRMEIELEDMQIAVKLSDERTLGLDPRQRIIHLIEGDVNAGEGRDLLKLINRDAVQNRYPPGAYSQRCYSYIPGIDAYPEVIPTEEVVLETKNGDEGQRKRSASFSFHSSIDSAKQNDETEGESKRIRFQQTVTTKDRPPLEAAQGFAKAEDLTV